VQANSQDKPKQESASMNGVIPCHLNASVVSKGVSRTQQRVDTAKHTKTKRTVMTNIEGQQQSEDMTADGVRPGMDS